MTKKGSRTPWLLAIMLLLTIASTSCVRKETRVIILADEDVVFDCPVDTINGRVYVCDSTMKGLSKSALKRIFNGWRECEAENERLKAGK